MEGNNNSRRLRRRRRSVRMTGCIEGNISQDDWFTFYCKVGSIAVRRYNWDCWDSTWRNREDGESGCHPSSHLLGYHWYFICRQHEELLWGYLGTICGQHCPKVPCGTHFHSDVVGQLHNSFVIIIDKGSLRIVDKGSTINHRQHDTHSTSRDHGMRWTAQTQAAWPYPVQSCHRF